MIFDEESASDAPKFLATPKLVLLEKTIDADFWGNSRKRSGVEVIFGPKSTSKTQTVYPVAKEKKEKLNELQAISFDEESASDAQKTVPVPNA